MHECFSESFSCCRTGLSRDVVDYQGWCGLLEGCVVYQGCSGIPGVERFTRDLVDYQGWWGFSGGGVVYRG